MKSTLANHYAKRIAAECSECFSSVKAVKRFGSWVIDIDGGSAACYGKTARDEDAAEDIIRIFANDTSTLAR